MKIGVIGASGKSGQAIVLEALNQGFDVTAIVRHENKSLTTKVIKKDIFNLTSKDIKDFDVIVDAFGVWEPDKMYLHKTTIEKLCDLLKNTDKRLIVVGGAGSLYLDKSHKSTVKDLPNFPNEYKPVANAMADALELLRTKDDVLWTYISPAALFIPNAPRTGTYLLAGEEFTINENGESKISYADYALALVDEIRDANHIRERISVLSK